MNLYLVRHGIAVNVGEKGVSRDADRMLSAEGREKTREAARGLARVGCRPDRILSSPYVRARETAEILQREVAPGVDVELEEVFAAGRPSGEMAEWLAGQEEEALLLVGHMPDMAALASLLLAGREDLDIVFKKAAVCHLSFADRILPGRGALEWLLQPRHLRGLAG